MNILISKFRFAVFLISLFAFGSAIAAPLTWTLNNVTTADGGMWTGTFDYDADTNLYSAINIDVTGTGTGIDGLTFNSLDSPAALGASCTYPATSTGATFGKDSSGITIFCMDFASSLTGSGGTINVLTGDVGWATIAHNVDMTGGSVSAVPPPEPVAVDIDIKPGQAGNPIHTNHNGSVNLDDVIKVGVLGSMTSVGDPIDFDATDIDPVTVRFGPALGAIDPASTPDLAANVDNDGIDDATFDFLTSDVGISCGETSATLSGETTGGQPFEGTDTIQTQCNVQCHN